MTDVVVHGAVSLASDHVNLPALVAELLTDMFSIAITVGGFVSHRDRRAKRHDSQEKLVGSGLECGYLLILEWHFRLGIWFRKCNRCCKRQERKP